MLRWLGIRKDQGADVSLSLNRCRHEASEESCSLQRETKGCPFGIVIEQSQYFQYCFIDCWCIIVSGWTAARKKWFAGHRNSTTLRWPCGIWEQRCPRCRLTHEARADVAHLLCGRTVNRSSWVLAWLEEGLGTRASFGGTWCIFEGSSGFLVEGAGGRLFCKDSSAVPSCAALQRWRTGWFWGGTAAWCGWGGVGLWGWW